MRLLEFVADSSRVSMKGFLNCTGRAFDSELLVILQAAPLRLLLLGSY